MTKKSILIIEDDFETQFLFTELLSSEGYEVKASTSGTEALEYLSTGHVPGLIFMDLNFPGGTPEEFTEKVRSTPATADVPIVIISGKSDIDEYAKRLKAAHYIKKPFDLDPLLQLIKKIL